MYFFIFSIILFFSIDLFISGIACGINNIKFKLSNILFISIIISITIICSFIFKHILIDNINQNLFKGITFMLLMLLGSIKIFNFFNPNKINNITDLYKDANRIDKDKSKDLSIKELIILVSSLAIDNMLVSLSLNISINYFIILVVCQFLFGSCVLFLSNYFSFKFNRFNQNIGELLSGILFIIIAIINIYL